jgi:hypothetical protein
MGPIKGHSVPRLPKIKDANNAGGAKTFMLKMKIVALHARTLPL